MHVDNGFHIRQVYMTYHLRSLNAVYYKNEVLKYCALNITKYCVCGGEDLSK